MLFSYKNHLWPALLLWVALTSAALMARFFFDLQWNMTFRPETIPQILLALAAIMASDGLLHGLLWAVLGEKYLRYYRALANHFSRQGVAEILAGGLLASAEEMFFRGVVLEVVAYKWGWGAPAGIFVAALLFALAHFIPSRRLAPFTLWAFWEGVLLGLVFVLSGSLLVAMCVHALHDIAGFTLFAYQRKTGRPLYRIEQPG